MSQREFFPGFPIDDDDPGDGRDLCRALDVVWIRTGTPRPDVRPDRPDPPVWQDPPLSVLRYPTPPLMNEIKARRLHLPKDIQPSIGTRQHIQPSIGTSLWPESCGNDAATVHVPVTIHGVTIESLLWGNVDIDQQSRLEGLVAEM